MRYLGSFLSWCAVALAIAVFVSVSGGHAAAATLTVGTGQTYSTIQAAIGAAAAGDTVIVKPGTYTENVTVQSKSRINLKADWEGAADSNVIIRAANPGSPVVYLYAAYQSVIDGFILEGAASSTAVSLGWRSEDVMVKNNIIQGNKYGITLYGTDIVAHNIFRDNSAYDVYIKEGWSSDAGIVTKSSGNVFYMNDFYGKCYDGPAASGYRNYWNSQEPIRYTHDGVEATGTPGNYFALYTQADADGDGIGDVPQNIGTTADYGYSIAFEKDMFPLVESQDNYPEVADEIIDADTTWSQSRAVNTKVWVNAGATLTVAPGVVLTFGGPGTINIEGNLVANGTKAAPVVFTRNDSFRRTFVTVSANGTAQISYADISHGGMDGKYPFALVVTGRTAKLTLDHSNLHDNYKGIQCYSNTAGNVRANRNAFLNNTAQVAAVYVSLANGKHDFTNNWWGSPTGPTTAQISEGFFNYDPWLTSPGQIDLECLADSDCASNQCINAKCFDPGPVCKLLPGRNEGTQDNRIDLIFVPDEDYGAAADMATWLPTFLDDINNQIDNRLMGKDPVAGNLDKFNFYYTEKQGAVDGSNCGKESSIPANLLQQDCKFADAVVVLHNTVFDDCASRANNIFSAEGHATSQDLKLRSFIHESGHVIFDLADEYDGAPACSTHYFQENTYPNIWNSQINCENDATTTVGWNPSDCYNFTACQNGWWKLGTESYIMENGTYFDKGWGPVSSRRINYVLNKIQSAPPTSEQSISLWLKIKNGALDVLDKIFGPASAPNYIPGYYPFVTKVYTAEGALLGSYGFDDPRIIQGEPGYGGPTFLEDVNFTVTVPYFYNIGRADIVDNASGNVMASIDLTEYAGNQTDSTPPVITANVNGTKGSGDWYVGNVVADWTVYDPETGIVSIVGCDKIELTENTNGTTVTCMATNGYGLSSTESVTIKIDKTAPAIVIMPVSGNYTEPFSFDWNIADPADGAASSGVNETTCNVKVDGTDVSMQCSGSYSLAVGTHVVSVSAADVAGNSGSDTINYTVNPKPADTGTLVIKKKSGTANGTFNFNVSGPATLAPSITTVNGAGTTGAITLPVGQYTLSEVVPAGWTLIGLSCSISCSGSCSSSMSQRNFVQSFKLSKGMKVTCTFTNRKK